MTPPPVPILTDTTVPIDTTQPSHGSINATPLVVHTNKKVELMSILKREGYSYLGWVDATTFYWPSEKLLSRHSELVFPD